MFWPFTRIPAKPEAQQARAPQSQQKVNAPYAPASRSNGNDRAANARRTPDNTATDFAMGVAGVPYPSAGGLTGYAVHQSMQSDYSNSSSSSGCSSSDYSSSSSSDSGGSSSCD